jgi:hypothetical protein
MRLTRPLAALVFSAAAVLTLAAQQKPAQIFSIEFQTVKMGMTHQYEAGRKAKAAWHKEKNDPRPLFVWEYMSGEQTGTFCVAQPAVTWKEMDNPPISDDADQAEWEKTMGTYVTSVVTHYYRSHDELSWPSMDKTPAKFSEVITFHVRQGGAEEFIGDIKKITAAIGKANWGSHYQVYSLEFGGKGDTFVLVVDHPNYADFEDPAKPFDELMADALGKDAATALMKSLDTVTLDTDAEMVKFRPDLSYMPAGMK